MSNNFSENHSKNTGMADFFNNMLGKMDAMNNSVNGTQTTNGGNNANTKHPKNQKVTITVEQELKTLGFDTAKKEAQDLAEAIKRLRNSAEKDAKNIYSSFSNIGDALRNAVNNAGELSASTDKNSQREIYKLGAAYQALGGDLQDINGELKGFWDSIDSRRGELKITVDMDTIKKAFEDIQTMIDNKVGLEYMYSPSSRRSKKNLSPYVQEQMKAQSTPEPEKPQVKKLDERSLKRADELERSLRATLKDFEQNSGISEDTAKRYIQAYHELVKLFKGTDEIIEDRINGATNFMKEIADKVDFGKDTDVDAKRENFKKNAGRHSKNGQKNATQFIEGENTPFYVEDKKKSPYERVSHYVDKDYFEQLSAEDIKAINEYIVSAKKNLQTFDSSTEKVVEWAKQLLKDIKSKNIEAIKNQIPATPNELKGETPQQEEEKKAMQLAGRAMLKQFVGKEEQETLSKTHFSGIARDQVLFDYSTEEMLDANKGATDEIKKMYDEIREKIGSTFKSGIDALNEFQARAKEAGLSFEGGRWIEVKPVPRNSGTTSSTSGKSESDSSSEPTENQKRYDSLEEKNKKAIDAYIKALGDKIKSIEDREKALTEAFKVLDSLDKASDTTLNPEERFKGLNKLFGNKKKANSVLLQEYMGSDTYAKDSGQVTTALQQLYGQAYSDYITSENDEAKEHKNKWKVFKGKQIGSNPLFNTEDMEEQKQIMEELENDIDRINKAFLSGEKNIEANTESQKKYIESLAKTAEEIDGLRNKEQELTEDENKRIASYDKLINSKRNNYKIRVEKETPKKEPETEGEGTPKDEEPQKKNPPQEGQGTPPPTPAETYDDAAESAQKYAEAERQVGENADEAADSVDGLTEAEKRLRKEREDAKRQQQNRRTLTNNEGEPAQDDKEEPKEPLSPTVQEAVIKAKQSTQSEKGQGIAIENLRVIGNLLDKDKELADKFSQAINKMNPSGSLLSLISQLKNIAEGINNGKNQLSDFSDELDKINDSGEYVKKPTKPKSSSDTPTKEKPQKQPKTPSQTSAEDSNKNNQLLSNVQAKITQLTDLRNKINEEIQKFANNADNNTKQNFVDLFNSDNFASIIQQLREFSDEELKAMGITDQLAESIKNSTTNFEGRKDNSIAASGKIQDVEILKLVYEDFNKSLLSLFDNVNELITAFTKLSEAQKGATSTARQASTQAKSDEVYDPKQLIWKTKDKAKEIFSNDSKAFTIQNNMQSLRGHEDLANLFGSALDLLTKELGASGVKLDSSFNELFSIIQGFNSDKNLDVAITKINDFITKIQGITSVFNPSELIKNTQDKYAQLGGDSKNNKAIKDNLSKALTGNEELGNLYKQALDLATTAENIEGLFGRLDGLDASKNVDEIKNELNQFITVLREANEQIKQVAQENSDASLSPEPEPPSSSGQADLNADQAMNELDKKVEVFKAIIDKLKNTIYDGSKDEEGDPIWTYDFDKDRTYHKIFNLDEFKQLFEIFNQFTDEELEAIGITKELKEAFKDLNGDLSEGKGIDWNKESKLDEEKATDDWYKLIVGISDDLIEIYKIFENFMNGFRNLTDETKNSLGKSTTQQASKSTPAPQNGQTNKPETQNQAGGQGTASATPKPDIPVIKEIVTQTALNDLDKAKQILQNVKILIDKIPEIDQIPGSDLKKTRDQFAQAKSIMNNGDKKWNKQESQFGKFMEGINIANTKVFQNGGRGGLKADDTYDTDWLLKQFMVKHDEGNKGKASAYYGIFREALGKDEAISQLVEKLKELNQGKPDYDYQKVAEEFDKTYQAGYELFRQFEQLSIDYGKQRNQIDNLKDELEKHAAKIRNQNNQNGSMGAKPSSQASGQNGTGQASGSGASASQGDSNANNKFRNNLASGLRYSLSKDVSNLDQGKLDSLIRNVQSGLLYYEDLFGKLTDGLSGLYNDFVVRVEQAVQNSGLTAREMDLSKLRDTLNANNVTSAQFYNAVKKTKGTTTSSGTSVRNPSPTPAPTPAPSTATPSAPSPTSTPVTPQPNVSASQVDLSGLNEYVTKLNEIIALLRKATEEFVQDGKLITSDIGKIISGFIKLRDTLVEVVSKLKNDDGSILEFTFNAQKFKEDLDKAINPFEIILKIQPDSLKAIQDKITELNTALNAGLQSAPSAGSEVEPTTPLPSSDQPVPSAEPITPAIDTSKLNELKATLEELIGLLRKATEEFVQDASLATKEAGKEVGAFIKLQESLQGVIDKLAGLKTDGVSDVPITFLPDFSNIIVELDKGLNPFELIIKVHPASLENAQQEINKLKLDLDAGSSSTPETADNETASLPEQTPDMTEQPKKATSEYEQLSEMIAQVREELTNLAGQFQVLEEKSAIEGEANLFGSLLTMLKTTIPGAIEAKNTAFQKEVDVVKKSVGTEVGALKHLKAILEEIGQKVSISIDMKNLSAFNKFLQSIEKTLKSNTLNDFKNALLQFQKAVNGINISNNKNNILGAINKILENKDALKDLVEALKATKQQLDNLNNQNPPSSNNQNPLPPNNQNPPSPNNQNPPPSNNQNPPPFPPNNNQNQPGTSVNNWNRKGYGDPKQYEQELGKLVKITEKWVDVVVKGTDQFGNAVESTERRLGARTLYGMHGKATETFAYDDQGVATSNGLGAISHVQKNQLYNLEYDTKKANIEDYKKQLQDAGLLTKNFENELNKLEEELKKTSSTDVDFTIYNKEEQKVADKINEALTKSKKLYADSEKSINALGKAQTDYNEALAKNIINSEKMSNSGLDEYYVTLYEKLVDAKEAMDKLKLAKQKGEISKADYDKAKELYDSDNIQQGNLASRMNVRDAGIKVADDVAKARTNLNKAEAEYIKDDKYENQLKLNEATNEYVQILNRAKEVIGQLQTMNQHGEFSDEYMTAVNNAMNSDETQFGSLDSRNKIMDNANDLIEATEKIGDAIYKIDSDRIKSGKTTDYEQKRIDATKEWDKSLSKLEETLARITELNKQGIIDDNQLINFSDKVDKLKADKGTKSGKEQMTMSIDKRVKQTEDAIKSYERAEKRLKEFQNTATSGGHVSGAVTSAADNVENTKKSALELIQTLYKVNEVLKDADPKKYQEISDTIKQLNARMQNPLSSPDSGFENATKGYQTLALNANTYLNIQKKIQSGQAISANESLFIKEYGQYFKLAAKGSQEFINKLGGVQQGSQNAAEEQQKLNEALLAYNKAVGVNKGNILGNISTNIETNMGQLGTKNNTPQFEEAFENLKAQFVVAKQEYENLQAEIDAMDWNGASEQDMQELLSKLDAVLPKFAEIQKQMNTLGNNKDFNPVDPLRVESLQRQMSEWSIRNSGAKEAVEQIKQLQDQLKNVNTQGEANKIAIQFEKIKRSAAEAGQLGKSFADKLKGAFSNLARYMMSFASFYRIVDAIRQGINSVKEMDTAMTDLRKVVDASDISFKNFEKQSYKIAASVGTTAQTIVQAAAEWGRLGYSLEDSAVLAKASAIYTNVGDIDATTATTDLVSAMKAFNIEATESMRVVDVLNEIGNNYAVSSAQLGEILKKSSSSLAVSGDSLEDVVAMGAAMNAVTQDASVTGSTLKVVGLRLRGAEADLKEAGEETEGMAISTSKLRGQIMALTKATDQGAFDIMKNPNEFKTTYEIIDGIAQRWDDIAQVDQAALLELMANSCHNIQKYI